MSAGICPTYCVCTTTPPVIVSCTGGPNPPVLKPAHSVPTIDGLALALTVALIAIVASILMKGRK